MQKHYDIIVTGKVQGVWYRQTTLQKAMELGIQGFVKNMPDGSVYIEAEGNEEQLYALVNWCKEGPEFAVVTKLHFEESDIKNFEFFEILK